MGFFAKLFGKTEEAAHSVAETTSDMAETGADTIREGAAQAGETATHVAAEVNEQIGYATDEAKEAMHDAAQGTPAEDVVEDTLGHDKQ